MSLQMTLQIVCLIPSTRLFSLLVLSLDPPLNAAGGNHLYFFPFRLCQQLCAIMVIVDPPWRATKNIPNLLTKWSHCNSPPVGVIETQLLQRSQQSSQSYWLPPTFGCRDWHHSEPGACPATTSLQWRWINIRLAHRQGSMGHEMQTGGHHSRSFATQQDAFEQASYPLWSTGSFVDLLVQSGSTRLG